MLSTKGWARWTAGAAFLTVLSIVGCEEDDAFLTPLVDEIPPTVAINEVTSDDAKIQIKASAEDFIAVSTMVIEIRDPNQLVTEITADGDTLLLGRLLAVDTTNFTGRVTSASVTVDFINPFTQATIIDIRAVAIDSQDNDAAALATVIVGGGGTGGGLGTPIVAITSPLPGQTVRDNTIIRVGVSASDQTGLQQLNVTLTGVTTQPQADTIRFGQFRSSIDTVLDFFIPSGNLGTLIITAEAINLNNISAFASISVTVAQVVSGDTIPPTVSMVVSGGVQRRLDEAPRMEADDSLLVEIVAQDNETAITRVGVTYVILNATPSGTVRDTVFDQVILNPPISGSVPVTFALVPETLPLSLFDPASLPDTLFFEVTAWAFDQATPANCGSAVDILGSPARLPCVGSGPVFASGATGGTTDRLIVQGRTIGFPQGSEIVDAVVDAPRRLLYLSDLEFGIVRTFDLAAEAFVQSIPVGSEPWGMTIGNTGNELFVSNSGGTNISVVSLSTMRETDRFQTQDLQVFQVIEDFDNFGVRIYPVTAFDYSDRPQFVAQAAGTDLLLFSTRPALENEQPGTIREYDPNQREIRFFISYAQRRTPSQPEIQVINADSVLPLTGGRAFKICDHERGNPANRSCVIADNNPPLIGLEEADTVVNQKRISDNWDTEIHSDLLIPSIGLQDTTFVVASGDREFIAFGEGDTPDRAGRIIMYQSATQTITNSLQVTDLTGNAAQQVFGLALDLDGRMGVGRGEVAFFFGPDLPGGPNTLRLLGTNNDILSTGTGAAIHPLHDETAFGEPGGPRRLSFLGSGDGRVEIVDTRFFDFKRGDILIRDPVIGPLRITLALAGDPPDVVVRLYGVTENGVVVVPVRSGDILPAP